MMMRPGISRIAGLPLHPPLEEERQIALLRLPLALPPLLVFLHCLGPVAHPRLAGAAAAGYVLYAAATTFAALQHSAGGRLTHGRFAFLALPRHLSVAIDLLFATLLVAAIGAPTLPPILLSLHAVLAAALRWGPAGAAATALLGAGMGGLALWHTPGASHVGVLCLFLLCAALLGIRLCGIFRGRGSQALAEERDRIARDLHDDFIQSLVAAGLRVELCRAMLQESRGEDLAPLDAELEELQRLLNSQLSQSRQYLATMRPPGPRNGSLAACLEECARELFRGQPVEARVTVSPRTIRLAPPIETAAFYIAREALFNARKHAAPQQVVVSLECRHDRVKVVVSDDGRGFQPSEGNFGPAPGAASGSGASAGLHRGLQTMRERAESLGGSLTLESTPGQGTRVIALLPLEQ
jgi:glucose-6-phosphate-specific signal transduction histidine kinase